MTATQPEPPAVLSDPAGPKASFADRLVADVVDFVILFFAGIPVLALGLGRLGDLLLGATYYVLLEGGPSGRTVGKRLVGLRVVDQDTGASIGRGRALVRHLGRFVSGFAMGVGYLWMLWDPRRQTWHDKMASAVVVRARAFDSRAGIG